ncbi:MAG TPA: BTAD domain-containing putative transcriptional regulator [Pseudonocardiaceae bacterium]|jgi:DNA-binding SARP family transcriptional activator|nr:BTAD domain-containing putative transcriptional regulator [Pseudonocardiaceae bacterium]
MSGRQVINFRVLGPIEATRDGRAVPLSGRKQRGVLAMLLLNANRTVPVDHLITGLWDEDVPGRPRNTLQVYVSSLRRVLEPDRCRAAQRLLITQDPGYRLQVSSEQLDLLQFTTAAGEGRRLLAESRYEQAAGQLRRALALWRGSALADLADEPFAQSELPALEESRLVAVEARIEAELALGRTEEIIGELNRLIADYPYRERFRGLLMLALYRSGRQVEALQAYQSTRKTLLHELGVDPGPELRELERAILAQGELGKMERRRRPFLLFHDGGGEQHLVALDAAQAPLTIGRRSSNDLSLAWDPEVSRAHAQLERTGDNWVLVDEGRSRNGSYVNGERVEGRRPLRDADVLRLGTTVLLYRVPTAATTTLRRETGVTADVSIRTASHIAHDDLAVLRSFARAMAQEGGTADRRAERCTADSLNRAPEDVEAALRLLYLRFGVAHLAKDERRVLLLERARSLGVLSTATD